MRKYTYLISILIGFGILGAGAALAYVLTAPPTHVQEAGSIAITMCPDCETVFLSLLRGGGTISCALYDFGDTTEAALRYANAQVISDDETGTTYGAHITQEGLMHNKFCIINNSVVVTGSYNPTEHGELNRNNLVVVRSATLARNYQAEYHALASGRRRARITHTVQLGNTTVQNYFCPRDGCEAQVLALLREANQSIQYFTYTFTSSPIATALADARRRGVAVTGVCDGGQWNVQGSVCTRTQARSWDLPNIMHHKVFIVDGMTVVTGSYNPTNAGDRRNSENILVITNPAVAAQFTAEYNRIWAESSERTH